MRTQTPAGLPVKGLSENASTRLIGTPTQANYPRFGAKLATQMSIPIALQLYSARQACASDLLGVIGKVAAMGYDGVEFAGYHGHSAEEIRKALDANGIKAEGTHSGLDTLADSQFQATVDLHKTLGCEYVIVPWMPDSARNTPEAAAETAKRLTELTERLREHGLRLGFHAHEGDMRPLSDGRNAWDHLAAGTPEDFILQYDTANGMHGGADPVQPILDHPGRNVSVHLKEFSPSHPEAAVGDGDIPWARVFEACETVGGTKWYVVEHEYEGEGADPLAAVERCLKNLRAMGK